VTQIIFIGCSSGTNQCSGKYEICRKFAHFQLKEVI